MPTSKYILFDIDGTLVNMQGGFMPSLIEELLRKIGRKTAVLNGHSYAGRTDRDIFTQLLQDNDVDVARYDEFRQLYIGLLNEMLTPAHINRLEGTRDAIEFCLERGHCVGLLTGNFREAAFIKLNRVDLDSYFSDGAFGGDEANRNKLPEQAFRQGRQSLPHLTPRDMIIIGDTPRDIACAKHFGCTSVGVATGPYSSQNLRKYEPDMVLESLAGAEGWIGELNL